ncbi:lipoprotein-releasing ABC transporter permease subunit [Acinetobacter sp. c2-A9]|uniref:lipoprotein-releasing ABC transporter permease subunit n=1 Tax=Acinetobacter sp. c2-A9 TaxID=3342802 RepID=UPI0035B8E3F3
MFKPLALFIGLKYTKSRNNNKFISFNSLMSMLGMMVGVAVLIIVLSVMNGFDREIKNRIFGMVSQATVSSPYIMPDWQDKVNKIESYPHVKGAAPFTSLQGMLTAQGQVSGIMINGIVPEQEKKVSIIQNHMVAGQLENLKDGEYGIILGKTMVDSLGLQLDDKITLVLPEATPSPAGVVPRFKRFTLVGIFDTRSEVDGLMGYIALNDAATMLRLPDGAQSIRIKLDNIFQAPVVVQQALKDLPPDFFGSDWTITHGNLFSAIQMEKTMIGLLLSLIILVAAFSIISSLMMIVNSKNADIAILRTIGVSPAQITRIFVVQGTLIGVVGIVLGTIIGVIVALNISNVFAQIMTVIKSDLLANYPVNYLPSELLWHDVAVIVSASLLLSFLATIYPALRAAKVQPAEALRYE